MTLPIREFAVSPDVQRVVFVSFRDSTAYGGHLYLLTVATGKVERLTHGYYLDGLPEPGNPEVYADPDLSPDGRRMVFAIHGQANGDVVEASGPLAMLDLSTRRVRILKATMNVDVGGVAFANNPHWSPDGNRILVNFENGAAVTEVTGTTLKNLDGMIPEGEGDLRFALGWVGRGCVLYMVGNTWDKARQGPKRVLNLRTRKTEAADRVIPPQMQGGLVVFSPGMVVRTDGNQHVVVEGTRNQFKPWIIPGDEKTTTVRILSSPDEDKWLPESCK